LVRRFQVVTFRERREETVAKLPISIEDLLGAGVHRNEVKGSDTDHTPRVLELGSQGSVEEKNQ